MATIDLKAAADFQDAFDAVMDGTPSIAQCHEVIAVAASLGGWLREADARARMVPDRREAVKMTLSPDDRIAFEKALPPEGVPRFMLDPETGMPDTPENIANRITARQEKEAQEAHARDRAQAAEAAARVKAQADATAAANAKAAREKEELILMVTEAVKNAVQK